jgi:hypothetical protein
MICFSVQAHGRIIAFIFLHCSFVKQIETDKFARTGTASEISSGIYASWEPHWMFAGETIEVEDKR